MLIKVNNKFPTIGDNTYIAPSSSVIGDVILNSFSSIWFGAVVRADNGTISIGERTNIQDNSVVHSDGRILERGAKWAQIESRLGPD